MFLQVTGHMLWNCVLYTSVEYVHHNLINALLQTAVTQLPQELPYKCQSYVSTCRLETVGRRSRRASSTDE